MTAAPSALLAGAALGLGLWVLLGTLPRFGRPSLTERIAPMLADVSAGARELLARRPADPTPVLGLVAAPALAPLRAVLGAISSAESIDRMLRQSGSGQSVGAFRAQQVVWCLGGLAAGAAVAAVLAATPTTPPFIAPVVVVLGGAAAAIAYGRMLQRAARRRSAALVDELPTMLEFLALSLSAGEGMLDAVHRLVRVSDGELARRLTVVTSEVATGVPLIEALERSAADAQVPAFSRLVEQLRAALDRGTPLVEVLHAQAEDARDAARRALLESAGRKEIAMLIPVVFLILPITVLFAVYPGLAVLRIGF